MSDVSWIKPGVVSWIYWAYNHGSRDYQLIKKYIDFAADFHLPYMLIDAEWGEMGNGGNVEDALAYANRRILLLCYGITLPPRGVRSVLCIV